MNTMTSNNDHKMNTVRQNEQLKSFVTRNIKAMTCVRAVQREADPNLCCCGRNMKDHTNVFDMSGKKWSAKEDLKSFPTDAYGEMKLSGFRVLAGVQLKYIRASQSEQLCNSLYVLMTHYWQFHKPELIISINGGAKKMIPLNNEQKTAFKRGLINVSKSASTWIITGGFNFGVSKLVGEAAKDYNIASQDKSFIVLGIGTWGAVYNRNELVVKEGHKVVYNNVEGPFNLKGQAPLDPNHDAFILFDSGIEGAFGKEIQFRTEFENFISSRAKCSVVQVIIEGGKKCIETADEALIQGIPVVVMKGSKRAADLICDVVEADESNMQDIIECGLAKYKDEWTITTDKEMDGLSKHLVSLHNFRKNNMIHIFNMSDFTKNLDRAILEAAFSGKINNKSLTDEEKLKLAMTFNRPEVAEECLLDSRNQISNYGEFIKTALVKNQWKFANMFISRGTKVESFLNRKFLEDLYFSKEANKYVNTNVLNIIGYLKDSVRSSTQNELTTIGLIVQKLTKNMLPNLYGDMKTSGSCCGSTADERQDEIESDEIKDLEKYNEPVTLNDNTSDYEGCCCTSGSNEQRKQIIYTSFPPKNKYGQRLFTEQDLFVWSLLTQRWEMAKIFWVNGKDHIGSALIACVIYKEMSKIATKEGESDMAQNLQENRQNFENLAIQILSDAYWRDKTRTHILLIRALPYWGRVTCMDIANKCQIINFLSHSACQTRLNAIWLGGMPMYTRTLFLLLNLPFAFLTSKGLIFGSKRSEDFVTQPLMESSSGSDETFDVEMPASIDESKSPKTSKEKEYLTKFRKQQQIAWQNVSFCDAVSYFYRAPITKFSMHIISYLLFLTIFSYMCLVELLPIGSVTTIAQRQMEYAVYTYIISFVLEEIRQSVADSQFNTIKGKMTDWISSLWNMFDLILYLLFLVAVILRHIPNIDFVYARTSFSVTLSMFFIRFLQFYYANRFIGPKVISVSKMIKDIVFFLALYVIAIFAYGTLAQALLFNNSAINGFLLKNIVYLPYFQSYGDLHLEYVEGTVALNSVSATPNAIVIVAFVFFMLFTNALLMNMLVAMFGMTFQKVEENANRIWAFNRYQLIEEFYFRPILPPPLNVFEIAYMACFAMRCTPKNTRKLRINEFVVNLSHDEDLRSAGFEQQCLEVFLLDNPMLKASTDNDPNVAIQNPTADLRSTNQNDQKNIEHIETMMSSMMEAINEMKQEIKTMEAQVHKVRRHQKRDAGQSRMNTMIRESSKSGSVHKVLPIDNEN